MKTLSFIVPIRIDNKDRYDNLSVCLKYLRSNFLQSEIILIEDSEKASCESICHQHKAIYFFRKNNGRFSKSNSVNEGIRIATKEFIVIYDVDILIEKGSIEKALEKLKKGRINIVIPHNSIVINIKGKLRQNVIDKLDISPVPKIRSLIYPQRKNKVEDIDIQSLPGGILMAKRELLLRIGGFNKKMISYGWEDIEVLKRGAKIGFYYFSLLKGNIIHLDHPRGIDSKVNEFYESNKTEFVKITSMSRTELIDYINNELLIEKGYYLTKDYLFRVLKTNIISLIYLRFILNRLMIKLLNKRLL